MNTQPKALSLKEQRSRLERRANVIRSRLLRTIDALDTRRHQVQEIGHHAKRLAMPAVAGLVGIAVVAAGTAVAIRALVERRRERDFRYRLSKAIAPFRRPDKAPFWQDALRKLALTAIGILASELAKRGVQGALGGRGAAALLPAHVDGERTATPYVATGPSAPMLGK
ncbi:MAG: hypothetical protein JWP87_2854 [Labilithrix sp.]|nr:hypothetical protein [Labilithrix sp.]